MCFYLFLCVFICFYVSLFVFMFFYLFLFFKVFLIFSYFFICFHMFSYFLICFLFFHILASAVMRYLVVGYPTLWNDESQTVKSDEHARKNHYGLTGTKRQHLIPFGLENHWMRHSKSNIMRWRDRHIDEIQTPKPWCSSQRRPARINTCL